MSYFLLVELVTSAPIIITDKANHKIHKGINSLFPGTVLLIVSVEWKN